MADDVGQTRLRPTSILVVDDHTTFAELLVGALCQEPDLESIGVAGGVEASVRLCAALRPDVVVMDYHLPDGNGLMASERILADRPETRIVMLTGSPEQVSLETVGRTRICALLPKDCSLANLLDTIRSARSGTLVVHPSIFALVQKQRHHGNGHVPTLTQRELDVLRLMAQGHGVGANAKILKISPHTCRGYVKNILAKLDAHSQLEAVVKATKLGLLAGDR